MAATVVAVVGGLVEGLQLITSLSSALASVSQAVASAQANGTPVDFTGIVGEIDTDEAQVLAAIAAAKALGR